jgi:hypothetical protein
MFASTFWSKGWIMMMTIWISLMLYEVLIILVYCGPGYEDNHSHHIKLICHSSPFPKWKSDHSDNYDDFISDIRTKTHLAPCEKGAKRELVLLYSDPQMSAHNSWDIYPPSLFIITQCFPEEEQCPVSRLSLNECR